MVILSVAAVGVSLLTYWYIQKEAEKAAKEAEQASRSASSSTKADPAPTIALQEAPILSDPATKTGGVCDKVYVVFYLLKIELMRWCGFRKPSRL